MRGRNVFECGAAALWLFLSTFSLAFAQPADLDLVRESGEIRGTVSYCGLSALSAGIEVSIPGKSFMARTGSDQKFTLSYVPQGTYAIEFRRQGRLVHSVGGVQVVRRAVTDLDVVLSGPVSFCPDLDGDGYVPPQDCDDFNPGTHPGSAEICGDGRDNNCNGSTDESCPVCTDNDGDGYSAQIGCGVVDCNDNDAAINPGAQEVCGDGVDNDCDGTVDESDATNAQTFYRDNDGDGFGTNADTVQACAAPDGYVAAGNDCDDTQSPIHPGAVELCDGLDNNCSGQVDDNCVTRLCTEQETTDFEACVNGCGGSDIVCFQQCLSVVSQQCGDAIYGLLGCTVAQCDAPDDLACAFQFCPIEWELVFGPDNPPPPPTECTSGQVEQCGFSDVGACSFGTRTCDSTGQWGACVGAQDPVQEICGDNIDNDCNGLTDEPESCAVCGNGVLEAGEGCDDGNTVSGDGCSSTCTLE